MKTTSSKSQQSKKIKAKHTKQEAYINLKTKTNQESYDEYEFIQKINKKLVNAVSYWKENYDAGRADLKFLLGEQWEETARASRAADKRPCLVNNVLPSSIDQIIGEQRQNRVSIKVNSVQSPQVDNAQDTGKLTIPNIAGTKDYEIAQVYSGIIKNIEYASDAETAYDEAFQSALETGFGFLRIRSDYVHDSFDQEIIIENINNNFSVTVDPYAKRKDYLDANFCFVQQQMTYSEFKELYPDAVPSEMDSNTENDGFYTSDNLVNVCEYFERVEYIKEIALLSDGRVVDYDKHFIESMKGLKKLKVDLHVKKIRKVKAYKVNWYKLTNTQILEQGEIAGSYIPIIPVWGKRSNLDGRVITKSAIRNSKDAQRMINYFDSAAVESVALAPKAPFIAEAEQIEGYEDQWQSANTKNHSVLLYNKTEMNSAPPQRQQAAAVPNAELSVSAVNSDKVKATMGIFDASLGNAGNETSGKAIIARQKQGDRGTFAFIDNLHQSITAVGKILVNMIPIIYDNERVMRVKFPDDSQDYVRINQTIYNPTTQKEVTIYDLNVGKYDVIIDTGAASASQKQEAISVYLEILRVYPDAAPWIMDLLVNNMDIDGSEELARRFKMLAPKQVLTPEEQAEIQKNAPPPAPPTPEQQVEMQKAQAEAAKAEATKVKAESDITIAESKAIQEIVKQNMTMNANPNKDYDRIVAMVEQAYNEIKQNAQNKVNQSEQPQPQPQPQQG